MISGQKTKTFSLKLIYYNVSRNWYTWFYLSFVLIILSSLLTSIILYTYPSSGIGLHKNQYLYLGFYFYKLSENKIFLNWYSYLLALLSFFSICISCLTYWMYKNSSLSVFSDGNHIAAFLLLGNIFQLINLLLCYINIPKIDFSAIEKLTESSQVDLYKYFESAFNFIYNFRFVANGNAPHMLWWLSSYGIASILFTVIGWITIIITSALTIIFKSRFF